jgi:hypothetical protein
MCREYSLNMAEAVDFSMPDAFAKDYLDRIIKKTEKSLNNTCILYTGRKNFPKCDHQHSKTMKNPHRMQ